MGCGVSGEYFLLSLDSTQSSRTHYKMQNNYFIPGFHKWQNTASWGSVRISFMDISMVVTYYLSSWREFTVSNSPKGFWRSLPEISVLLFSFVNPNHLRTQLPNHWCPFPLHSQSWMPWNQQSNIPTTLHQNHRPLMWGWWASIHVSNNLKWFCFGCILLWVDVVQEVPEQWCLLGEDRTFYGGLHSGHFHWYPLCCLSTRGRWPLGETIPTSCGNTSGISWVSLGRSLWGQASWILH